MADIELGNPFGTSTNQISSTTTNEDHDGIEMVDSLSAKAETNDDGYSKSQPPTGQIGNSHQDVTNNSSLGMTKEEQKDPNKIRVTIADDKTPIIVLFGPPTCGKTMTLIRLVRYLHSLPGYTVRPVSSFRPSDDENYKEMCEGFEKMIDSDDAAKGTGRINFMLVTVSYNGRPLCQVLEAPGEGYFVPSKPTESFPRYVNAIISSKNRKIWAIMVEPDDTNESMGYDDRKNYANKVRQLKKSIKSHDKIIFVFNKIDKTDYIIGPGRVNYRSAMKYIGDQYLNLFVPFLNQNPLTKWFQPYNFGFAVFQTGFFQKAEDGTYTYQEGDDIYPKKLWEMIRKRI